MHLERNMRVREDDRVKKKHYPAAVIRLGSIQETEASELGYREIVSQSQSCVREDTDRLWSWLPH